MGTDGGVNSSSSALFAAIFGESDSDVEISEEETILRGGAAPRRGESSGEDEDSEQENKSLLLGLERDFNPEWEEVKDVEGLWHCSHYLPPDQQDFLVRSIEREGWFCDPNNNQAMRFGNFPNWAANVSQQIRDCIYTHQRSGPKKTYIPKTKKSRHASKEAAPLPNGLLEREPLFDQMIVNSYRPHEGITAHVDLLRFEDGIAIMSLGSPCVMTFRPVNSAATDLLQRTGPEDCQESGEALILQTQECEKEQSPVTMSLAEKGHESSIYRCERTSATAAVKRVDVLLNPGDLLVTHGQARYNWTHEIRRDIDAYQVWQGQPLVQERRLSITLRKMVPQ